MGPEIGSEEIPGCVQMAGMKEEKWGKRAGKGIRKDPESGRMNTAVLRCVCKYVCVYTRPCMHTGGVSVPAVRVGDGGRHSSPCTTVYAGGCVCGAM